MSVQRRRDPRLPGPRLEDVSTMVGGEDVTARRLSLIDEVIAAAHQDALDQKRYMWGLDRDEWLVAAEELKATHPEFAKLILCRWCDIAIQAMEHDSREPDPHGFMKLADLYHREGDHGAEHDLLAEFLTYWPADRDTAPRNLPRIKQRVRNGCGRDN